MTNYGYTAVYRYVTLNMLRSVLHLKQELISSGDGRPWP